MNEMRYYPCGFSGVDFLSEKGSIISHLEYLENGCIRLIECDKEEKTMKVKEKKGDDKELSEINMDGLKQGVSIDLNEKGDRWEGDSLNNSPFGYGCIYNSENQIIYKGFMFKGMKVCFGSEFYGNVGILEYEGEYYKNMRCGYGKLYDRMNELIYEGDWFNNDPIQNRNIEIKNQLDPNTIHYGLERIMIGNNCNGPISHFCFFHYDNLKSLIIGNKSFNSANCIHFEINECNNLETVNIGENSFCNRYDSDNTSNFIIINCNKLNCIELGKVSINQFKGKLLLQSMMFLSFLLVDLPSLKELAVNDNCCSDFYEAVFESIFFLYQIHDRS